MTSDQISNKSIAELLRNIAAAYMLQEGPDAGKNNRFKIIAYQKAADTIEHLSRELKDIWQEGKLQKVPGIGPGIGSGLSELFENGTSSHFNEVLRGIPDSVFLLMKVPGIGPKKAFRLVAHFGLTDKETVIYDLKNLARAGEIEGLEGFGKKSQDDILEGLDVFERQDRREERMPMPFAIEIATEVTEYMNELGPIVKRIDSLGSLRRRVATIGDIDLAVVAEERDMQKIIDHFLKYPGKRTVEAAGERKASILAAGNIRIDLRVQDSTSYGSMLQYFTGSKAHNIKLREYALRKGYSLNEYGMKKINKKHPPSSGHPLPEGGHSKDLPFEGSIPPKAGGGMLHEFKDEESLYSFLGLQTPSPELREGTREIEFAEKRLLPKLVENSDIKGDFHIHSSYDLQTSHDLGSNTFEEMTSKAKELHYAYIGFSEHNPKQKNLSEAEVVTIMKERKAHIDRVMKNADLPYFIGLEVDILPNGSLALPDTAFEYVDYLIVSLHSSFKMNMAEMTKRVLKALSYPKVKIFGHPTARLLGKREGVEMDWGQIFEHVVKHNQALEINSGPSRLDLPDSLVKEGVEKGVKFFINTDAHAARQMDWMEYGVFVARRGWLE
ncbi:MAG: helix-hairpin-helix domain-containing protein, partial [Candidatus Roizmanbacteria bacterium]|nr:helix-hairpin-helix domain-containing protein [Candidatus Roizmanbacteria bacterium]